MVGTLQQCAVRKNGIEKLPMDKNFDLPITKVLVEIKHPLIIWKSDLTGLLKVSEFRKIRPYFDSHIFPNLAFTGKDSYLHTKKFSEGETQMIFALLFQQHKLTQQRINNYYENGSVQLDALTETIIEKRIIPLIKK